MKCENCQAEITTNDTVCPECGGPLPQKIQGFENAVTIQRILKAILDASGNSIYTNNGRLVALLNDCLADFDKERRLLVNMVHAGILRGMVEENDRNIAVMRARSSMQSDCFIVESAAEFALSCFTYFLGWPYDSPLRVNADGSAVKREEKPQKDDKKDKAKVINAEERVFRPQDAIKFRFARNVHVPEGFTKLESFCFDRFGSMRTIELPATLISIGEYSFSECKHLKTVSLPASLRIIQQGAFSQCAKLTALRIPEGVLEIADNTFLCCQSLEVIEIPATVTSIGASAFSGCTSLRSMFLSNNVKYIDEDAFMQCPALTIGCIENSYVHKFCLSHDIKFKTFKKEIEA